MAHSDLRILRITREQCVSVGPQQRAVRDSENTHTYYVNDGSTTGDQYTTAVGSNRNTGRLPSSPKPLLSTIFEDYALGGSDTFTSTRVVTRMPAASSSAAIPPSAMDRA